MSIQTFVFRVEVGGKKPCEVETQKYRRKWIFTFVYINGNKKYVNGNTFKNPFQAKDD